MFEDVIRKKAAQLVASLGASHKKLSTAESCTGGLLASSITDVDGASAVFERGYVTYSNQSKIELLTVPTYFIEDYGAVSLQTAVAMAEGALLLSRADFGIAITGIAGPTGAEEGKPVGTVFIALASKSAETIHVKYLFDGSRQRVRMQAVENALDLLLQYVK